MASVDPDGAYYPTPTDLPYVEAWETERRPLGVLLGPDGAVARVVMPERIPFGFQSRGRRGRHQS